MFRAFVHDGALAVGSRPPRQRSLTAFRENDELQPGGRAGGAALEDLPEVDVGGLGRPRPPTSLGGRQKLLFGRTVQVLPLADGSVSSEWKTVGCQASMLAGQERPTVVSRT
ncbi:hypothetical protein C8035_v011852 [Colletotrichum spinosum]|uniref:Uncharacterized protein n=1 Tax=Colletotrichum spinosum TaxID=1347390 RepID=A0A4R8Q5E9_9PEZI|nr:hypothetical protein C8035_v011852 [Colletotrichum spinosum]